MSATRGAHNAQLAFKRASSTKNFVPPVERPGHLNGVCGNLRARKPNYIYDDLTRTPTRLLDTALSGILPQILTANRLPKPDTKYLPAGYHLIHFPPPTTPGLLLPDGTDTLHFPGEPWVRRMWAGGSIEFKSDWRRECLNYARREQLHCREKIQDVTVKGSSGNEKIFVRIERTVGPSVSDQITDYGSQPLAIVEKRDLVFMHAKTPTEAKEDVARESRTIKPIIQPDFSITMTPDTNLLFRFSALTYNAHRIHLDRQYAREVEGYRNLVVHGPLSLALMLKVLSSQIGEDEMVKNISYRNLAPLFADEQMTICVRRILPQRANHAPGQVTATLETGIEIKKWDVWIQGPDGGFAVKGSAETGFPDSVDIGSAR